MATYDLSHAVWRKSAYSGTNGSCVEVAVLSDDVAWQKRSTHSGQQENCADAARNVPGAVAVRDSKDPAGPALAFGSAAWQDFTARIRAGELR